MFALLNLYSTLPHIPTVYERTDRTRTAPADASTVHRCGPGAPRVRSHSHMRSAGRAWLKYDLRKALSLC